MTLPDPSFEKIHVREYHLLFPCMRNCQMEFDYQRHSLIANPLPNVPINVPEGSHKYRSINLSKGMLNFLHWRLLNNTKFNSTVHEISIYLREISQYP